MDLNQRNPFVGVRLQLHDGSVVVGCRDDDGTTDREWSVFVPYEVLPRRVAADLAVAHTFPLPVAPDGTYQPIYKKTGGVSSVGMEDDALHRRHVIAAEPTRQRAPLVLVDPPPERLERFLATFKDVHTSGDPIQTDEHVFVTVTTPGDAIQHTIFAAAKHGLDCASLARRMPTILCDTLFRAMHTYAQQTKIQPMHEVGPTRDLWRFCMEHVPPAWLEGTLAPFTWEAYARHLFEAHLDRLDELPQPLRDITLREGLKMTDELLHPPTEMWAEAAAARRRHMALEAEAAVLLALVRATQRCVLRDVGRWALECSILSCELDDAHAASAVALRGRAAAERKCTDRARRTRRLALARPWLASQQPVGKIKLRCPPLTEAQQTQCMHLFHCLKFGAYFLSTDEVAAGRAALLQFALRNGSVPRLVTVYEKSSNFVGFGQNLRHAPLSVDDLPPAVRNRCRVREGQLMGGGGQGCKGIVYAPKAGNRMYEPLKQHKRRLRDNEEIVRKRLRTS